MTIERKQQRISDSHGTAKQDQLTTVTLTVGSFCQPQADEDTGNGIDGVEQANPKRLRPHFTAEEQTERRCLQRPRHAHHEGHQHKSGIHAVQASPHRHQPEHAQVLVKANRNWVK